MGSNPETIYTESDETTDFTADQWREDLAEFLEGVDLPTPRQPDEFTLQDFMDEYKLTRWVARQFVNRQIRQGVWSIRKIGNTKLYRIAKK